MRTQAQCNSIWDEMYFIFHPFKKLFARTSLSLLLCRQKKVLNQTKSQTLTTQLRGKCTSLKFKMSVIRNESCVCDARRESCDVFSRDIWREVQSMDCDRPKQLDSWLSLRPNLSLNLDRRLLTRQQSPDWKCASRTTAFTVIPLAEELRGRESWERTHPRGQRWIVGQGHAPVPHYWK